MSYSPDIAIHPGKMIAQAVDREGMSQKSLCVRTGITEKHLSQIINGEASITVETALLLENALGGSASFWINLGKNYQETKARIDRLSLIQQEIPLLSKFPYNELAKRGYVDKTSNKENRVINLWKFFGVNSLSYVHKTEPIAFRKQDSPSIRSEHIAAWLRCGELEAKKRVIPEYSELKLKAILAPLKHLSTQTPENYSSAIVDKLNEVGVAVIFIEHFPGSKVSGAVRWINNTPVIQLSLFYSWADIFWFNLYHELGHLLLHGKKEKFLEFDNKELSLINEKEEQADKFAINSLIPVRDYDNFVKNKPFSTERILAFAKSLKIHPGIVAGRLGYDGKVRWNAISNLRTRLKLSSF